MTMQRSASHWGAFRAEVVDGRIKAVLPFEHDPRPSPLNSVWPEMINSPLRVAAPAVRSGWLEGDGGRGRGEDDFFEVTWDHALDLAAGEIGRVRETFGNEALFAGSYGWSSAGRLHHARTLVRRFFNSIGGFTDQATNYSYGAAMTFLPRVVGARNAIGSHLTSVRSIRDHCDVMLAFGGLPAKNWEVQSGGSGEHRYDLFMAALSSGKQLVNISPLKADVSDDHACRWIPIRPNTDTALMLAIMRVLDREGAADRAFLQRYCTGAGILCDYLAGKTDGVEKTPQWASGITAVPAETIEDLALGLIGKRVLVTANWSLQRARHGEQPYWAAIALAAMLGQIGLPGGGFAFGYGSSNGMGNPRFDTPLYSLPVGDNPTGSVIPVARVADMLLTPGGTFRYDGRVMTYPDIRLVYWAGGNPFHHHQDLNRLREAFRRPQTVIVNECYWTATARHADIVFPATTALERDDIGGASRDPFILAMHKLVEPVGQARNDYQIFAALAERLGAHQAFTEGRSEKQWLEKAWQEISARLAARGIVAPPLEQFWERGYVRIPDPDDDYVMFADFRADPERHRLNTPSGKIELFSRQVVEFTNGAQPGHPVWLDPEEWLGAKVADSHPIHLLTPQPARRLHGQMDWSAHSRAGKRHGREIVKMHRDDALARGIGDGDVVRLFNGRGACLAVAELETAMMRGVALLATGATYDPEGKADRNSNPNVLTRDIGTSELGQGCAAQSCLVEIERFDGSLPELRIERPPIVRSADDLPDEFAGARA